MFFRREKPQQPSFAERIEALRRAGFTVEKENGGRVRVTRNGCAAIVDDNPGGTPRVGRAGILVGGEIAVVEHGGFQMFLRTPGGKRFPALAAHLKALHAFDEDLREALGLTSYYNTSLGTICDLHHYDRVAGRERGAEHPGAEH